MQIEDMAGEDGMFVSLEWHDFDEVKLDSAGTGWCSGGGWCACGVEGRNIGLA